MQIKGDGVSDAHQAYSRPAASAQRSQETEKKANKTQSGIDRVDLSEAARQLKAARKLLQAVPDVRADKVARIKQQVQEGSYTINSQKAAARLVEEALLNQSPDETDP